MAIYRNQRLFSDYYLQKRVPDTSFWEKVKEEELQKAFDEIKSIYEKQKTALEDLNESQLEERFIRPILRRLGHIYEVNVSLPRTYEGLKHPDYALYSSEESKKAGVGKAVAIGEAKRYGRPLDRKLKTESDPFEVQNPSLQMSRYLWISEVPWGILTDGRFWRLYERETSKRLDIFYEIDLFKLIKEGSLDEFKYFYLFFRKDAFPDFLRKVYNESLEYAKAVGKELKENVYHALRILAEGFMQLPDNKLTTETIEKIHDNSLILLYRLLFILYAEYRKLLPLGENELYTLTYSLDAIKKEIAQKLDSNISLPYTTTQIWRRLKELFETINNGNKELNVPPYNGGLFDPQKHPFLEKYKAGDYYLAEVIDLLSRSQDKAFIDYASLDIRHLGSIYEGLLEYKLKVAQQDMKAVKEKGKLRWKPSKDIKNEKIIDEVSRGSFYLVTDKGERKATGSYYTPDYIVEYIIENTLSPIIEEKKRLAKRIAEEKKKDIEDVKKEIRSLKTQVSRATTLLMKSVSEKKLTQKEAKLKELEIETAPSSILIDEILKTKVLDPAMGSGHFLVEATDYLARALVETLSGEIYPKEEASMVKEQSITYEVKTKDIEEDDLRWARREVVERCIYGVDLNPLAVELAKLSLWLSTVAKDKPLSFLDHHLRCGNSLIGGRVRDLSRLPDISKKKKETREGEFQFELFGQALERRLPIVLGDVVKMLKKPSDKVEQIREKENIYNGILNILTPFKEVANVCTSVYFGNENISYEWMLGLLETPGRWKEVKQKGWFKKAEEINKQKHFFHWELEFPEVFFDEKGRDKDNPGFDAVVGNPPYINIYELTKDKSEIEFFKVQFSTAYSKFDSYVIFVEQGIHLIKNRGYFSYIHPGNFLFVPYGKQLCCFISEETRVRALIDLMDFRIFEDAQNTPVILVLEKQKKVNLNSQFDLVTPSRELIEQGIIKGKHYSMRQERFISAPASVLSPGQQSDRLVSKILDQSMPLSEICYIHRGLTLGKIYWEHKEKYWNKDKLKKFVKGRDISRFCINYRDEKIAYERTILTSPFSEPLFEPIKLLLPKISKLCAAYDDIGYYADSTVIFAIPYHLVFRYKTFDEKYVTKSRMYSLLFILLILNSSLFQSYFSIKYGASNVVPELISQLPIRRISFITLSDTRKQLFEEGKRLYVNYLSTNNWDSITFFVQQRLLAKPEESDVIHDLLAFLAEKMIEYNKAKNEEIKSFLKWLERGIGAEIENLSNKTAIKDYHKGTINDLLNILKKNKKKLKIDPTRREFQDKISEEFTKSTSKLAPLKHTIEATDKLIDQIVYKLYNLTDEEIKIVEGVAKR